MSEILLVIPIICLILLILENLWKSLRTSWHLANWDYEYAKRGYKDDFTTVKDEG